MKWIINTCLYIAFLFLIGTSQIFGQSFTLTGATIAAGKIQSVSIGCENMEMTITTEGKVTYDLTRTQATFYPAQHMHFPEKLKSLKSKTKQKKNEVQLIYFHPYHIEFPLQIQSLKCTQNGESVEFDYFRAWDPQFPRLLKSLINYSTKATISFEYFPITHPSNPSRLKKVTDQSSMESISLEYDKDGRLKNIKGKIEAFTLYYIN